MTRPRGYSVERQDDGRIALVHAERCWTCSGSGKVAHSWEVTCPDGCTFEAQSRPVSSSVKCKKCPGRWDSPEFKAVSVMGACWDCRGGAGMCCSMTLFEVEAARTLRDALTAALGETSERAAIVACLRRGADVDLTASRDLFETTALLTIQKTLTQIAEAFERGEHMRPPDVPDASVASEGAAKGAGSSKPGWCSKCNEQPYNIRDGVCGWCGAEVPS
jgi:hypothetical protein